MREAASASGASTHAINRLWHLTSGSFMYLVMLRREFTAFPRIFSRAALALAFAWAFVDVPSMRAVVRAPQLVRVGRPPLKQASGCHHKALAGPVFVQQAMGLAQCVELAQGCFGAFAGEEVLASKSLQEVFPATLGILQNEVPVFDYVRPEEQQQRVIRTHVPELLSRLLQHAVPAALKPGSELQVVEAQVHAAAAQGAALPHGKDAVVLRSPFWRHWSHLNVGSLSRVSVLPRSLFCLASLSSPARDFTNSAVLPVHSSPSFWKRSYVVRSFCTLGQKAKEYSGWDAK